MMKRKGNEMTEAITMTVTLTPNKILDIVESAAYGVIDNFSDEALKLGGATRKDLIVAMANDPKIRRLVVEELQSRLDYAVDEMYVPEEDVEGTAIAEQIMNAFEPVQAIFDSVAKRDEIDSAIALLKANGYTVQA